ncbi:DUF1810 family protein [Skermanella stibiiresistens]|uniref:DUF1810 family protein n=1 Tax=Skermanella stibiiresistens TaxID=913326 RepID=UPI0004B9D40B|nr:DUF1810 family protein [Skermanella stibiiresistens]
MTTAHNLDRFVQAQEPVIAEVRRELESGRKSSHWMWFVFPQMEKRGQDGEKGSEKGSE